MSASVLHRAAQKLRTNTPRALLARGVSAVLSIRIFGAAAGMLLHILLARVMGAADYGVFVYAFNWLLFLEVFCTLGFGRTIVRFAPVYRSRGEWALLHGLLRTGNAMALSVGVLFAAGLASTVLLLGNRLSGSLRETLLVGCLLLPLAGTTKAAQETLRGFNRIALSLFPRRIFYQVFLGFFVGLLLVTHAHSLSPTVAMGLCVLSMVATLGLVLLFKRHALRSCPMDKSAAYDLPKWLGVALPMLLTAVFQIANRRAGILLAGVFLHAEQVGIYAVDNRLAQVLDLASSAMSLSLAPIVSQLVAEKRMDALQQTVSLATRGMVLLTVPAGIVLLVAGRPLLSLFGSEFASGYSALALLVATYCLCAAMGPAGELLLMTGHHRTATVTMAAATVLNIVLSATLMPLMGIEGAALATLLCLGGSRVVLFIEVTRKLKLNPTIFYLKRSRP